MLEVVFSHNVAGSIAFAQHCADGCIGSEVSVAYAKVDNVSKSSLKYFKEGLRKAEYEVRVNRKNTVSIGGKKEDIFCFSNDLSTGDISGDCLSKNRFDNLKKLFAIFPDDVEFVIEDLKNAKKNFDGLIERASTGEIIRIWYSQLPLEYCCMCWFISEIKKRMEPMPEIHLMCLPNQVEKDNVIRNYNGWGGVCSEELCQFLPLEKEASKAFIMQAIAQWKTLQNENAPLRAFINGTLQSVSEDFYDRFIEREISIAEPEFNEAFLIGDVLGKYQLGIGDVWIAVRIEKMIEEGKLTPITKPKADEIVYRRMLRKNTEF